MSDQRADRRTHYLKQQAAGEIRLVEFWRIVRADWPVIVAVTVVFAAAAVVTALVMTPIYRAETTVTVVDSGGGEAGRSALFGQLGGLAGLAGVNLSGLSGRTNRAQLILNSRTLIEEFIKRYDLLPVLFEGMDASDPRFTLWRGVEAFKRIYDVKEDTQTGLVQLRVEWPDAQLASSWANQFVELANDLLRQRDLADAERNIEYLSKQLALTTVVELQQAIYNLIEGEMKTLMLANARDEYAFSVIDPAVVPELRARPKRKQLAVLGTLFGLIVGVFLVVVRRSLRTLRETELAQHSDDSRA